MKRTKSQKQKVMMKRRKRRKKEWEVDSFRCCFVVAKE